MPRKYFYLIIAILVIGIAGALAYFFFYLNRPAIFGGGESATSGTSGGFSPFGSSGGTKNGGSGTTNGNGGSNAGGNASSTAQTFSWPKVREIWATPVGGFAASTTGSVPFVRFVDRGTGHIYDMLADSSGPVEVSNTTVPLIYESYWSKDAMAAVFRYIEEGGDTITNFYVQLRPTATPVTAAPASTTASSTIPSQPVLSQTQYDLRGAHFPGTVLSMAVSPSGKQAFTIELVNGQGVGFVSNLDGSGSSQVFSTPLTQVDAFWPATGTLMMATKASASAAGYLYSIDAKTGAMSEVLGGVMGLSVLPNPTGQLVLYSDLSNSGSLVTSLYDVKAASSQDLPFVTLPEKCVWSKANPVDLYCAVPTTPPTGDYPDAWYQGTASTVDRIWEVDTDTGATHLASDLLQDGKAQIDAELLRLDPTERFLYFVNKKDLSLWSVDLDQVNQNQ